MRTVTLLGLVLAVNANAAEEKPMIREVKDKGFTVRLDLSQQVLRLDVPEERDYAHDSRGPIEAPILPTLAGLTNSAFVSASMLAEKAKQFDDGLYAAVDLAAQRGVGTYPGKTALLRTVAERFAAIDPLPQGNAFATVVAGAKLGGLALPPLPAEASAAVESAIGSFLADELRAKPIGFYTWSRDLEAIFRQDRMLQTELKGRDSIARLIAVLTSDNQARTAYTGYLDLVSKLTNPLVNPDLRDCVGEAATGKGHVPERGIYFFPPSMAHETELIKQLYGDKPIPDGFVLVDEMIKRVRSGELSLKPTPKSGWYDYQTWALEPLIVPEKTPEAARLSLDETYRKQLVELFKGVLARTRETHIKQLEIPTPGSAGPGREQVEIIIHIDPELSAEPLAEFYARRAASYRFIRQTLEATFGTDALKKLHRQTAEGPVVATLADELQQMEALFYGAYIQTCRQLGHRPDETIAAGTSGIRGADADAVTFGSWAANVAKDIDLGRDGRMMVPVFYDLQRKQTKVWAFLGWSTKHVDLSFAAPPPAEILDSAGKKVTADPPTLKFGHARYALPYPVMAETYVTKILNRAEFQAHCDRHKTRATIVESLK